MLDQQDHAVTAAKVAPPIIVSILQTITSGLPVIILWMTAIYTAIQLYLVCKKLLAERQAAKNQNRRRDDGIPEETTL
jgi:hypothetical protein